MPAELTFSLTMLLGFLLTLVRVAGAFVFVPLPGITSVISPARIILALGITVCLFSQWPHLTEIPSGPLLALMILPEAALGIGIGLAVAFVTESISVGAQMLGLQAGFSFASTIDPNTQADSTVMVVFSQVAAGLLFFTIGLDRGVLQIFALSLEKYPPGTFQLSRNAGEQILLFGSTMFSTGLRLAFPVIAVLAMVDISLALLGRVNAQLQLLHLAFPIKVLLGMTLFAWLTVVLPPLMRGGGNNALTVARHLIAP